MSNTSVATEHHDFLSRENMDDSMKEPKTVHVKIDSEKHIPLMEAASYLGMDPELLLYFVISALYKHDRIINRMYIDTNSCIYLLRSQVETQYSMKHICNR